MELINYLVSMAKLEGIYNSKKFGAELMPGTYKTKQIFYLFFIFTLCQWSKALSPALRCQVIRRETP